MGVTIQNGTYDKLSFDCVKCSKKENSLTGRILRARYIGLPYYILRARYIGLPYYLLRARYIGLPYYILCSKLLRTQGAFSLLQI